MLAQPAVATLVAITLCVFGQATAPGGGGTANQRSPSVRSTNGRIVQALAQGTARSPTFAQMLEELQGSDVILHMEAGECDCRGARACLTFLSSSGNTRYLRGTVSLRRTQRDLIAAIGHELWHAVELARSPEVVDRASLSTFYAARARRSCAGCGYETAEAIASESAVRRELQSRDL
mgnify:CR=1 FL=1